MFNLVKIYLSEGYLVVQWNSNGWIFIWNKKFNGSGVQRLLVQNFRTAPFWKLSHIHHVQGRFLVKYCDSMKIVSELSNSKFQKEIVESELDLDLICWSTLELRI